MTRRPTVFCLVAGTGFGSATFGRVTSTSGDPRNAQIGLKFLF